MPRQVVLVRSSRRFRQARQLTVTRIGAGSSVGNRRRDRRHKRCRRRRRTPFTVSIPTVTGPIPSTRTNFPYIAEGFDVEPPVPAGYVEQEYFFSGTGNLYEYT